MSVKKNLKKLLFGIHNGFVMFNCKISKLFGYNKMLDEYMKNMVLLYEKNTDYYAAYRIREKKAAQLMTVEQENDLDASVAIIIQGPLVLEDHFTLETVRIYGKLYPSAKVILTTWDSEEQEELDIIRKEKNCIVVTSKLPDDPGVINVNYQCVSTRRGIDEAKKIGASYVAKTRTDWRMYQKGVLRFMIHMLDQYPTDNYLFKQNKRIISQDISTSETSLLFYPYFISDIFQFGNIDDMEKYWNHPLCEQGDMTKMGLDSFIRDNNMTWKERIEKGLIIEARLCRDYYFRMSGKTADITVDEFWRFLRSYFMILPRSITGGYWYKYEDRRICESDDWGTCYKEDSIDSLLTYNFDFVNWMNLYCDDLDYPEKLKKMCNIRKYTRR